MNASKLIPMGLLFLGLMAASTAHAQQEADHEAIAERLAPVGQLCLEGEDCGTAMASADAGGASTAGDAIDGEGIYGSICMACHETGAAGSPVRGDEAAWAERTEKGFATLLDHAINGFNAMPARGGNPNLSDAEVRAAVAHLVEPVMDVPATDESAADAGDTAAAEGDGEGESTATEATTGDDTAAAEDGPDGEALYASAPCAACHAAGVAGAPVLGDAEAWGPRIDKGIETLYANAINGIGTMPPKGGAGLPDAEIKAIVDYMVSEAQ